jgi:hypothetical protein
MTGLGSPAQASINLNPGPYKGARLIYHEIGGVQNGFQVACGVNLR